MPCIRSQLFTRYTQRNPSAGPVACCVLVFCASMIYCQHALAVGGCGSVCLPLGAIDPEKAQVRQHQLRFGSHLEYARFDNYREGDSPVDNPGGNEAVITQTTFFVDYGFTSRFTASLLVPYVDKDQETNRFGSRSASGLGDISVFGRYNVLPPAIWRGPSLSIGLGLKFPTGATDEPDGKAQLPPAFQNGSGAYDIVPTLSYYHAFKDLSLHGNIFYRVPLEENDDGYRFGREFESSLGVVYPIPIWGKRLAALFSVDYLNAGHDEDTERFLPARVRRGDTVLNTGGEFVEVAPGLRVNITRGLILETSVSLPVHQDWHGDRARNVGQVAPDATLQANLTYNWNL